MKRTLVALAVLSLPLAARAETPRAIARDEGIDVSGLPALSGDGSTIAVLEPFEASSDASLTAVLFLRVGDGARSDRWVVLEADDAGRPIASVGDGRGATPWRRAKNLTLRWRAEGYRTLTPVGEAALPDESVEPIVGAGLRVAQGRDRVTIRADRDGHVRWSGRVPPMPAFCGMSDEHPRDVPPRVLAAWVDRRSKIVLLEVGHVYASCMCPADIAHLVVTLERP